MKWNLGMSRMAWILWGPFLQLGLGLLHSSLYQQRMGLFLVNSSMPASPHHCFLPSSFATWTFKTIFTNSQSQSQ